MSMKSFACPRHAISEHFPIIMIAKCHIVAKTAPTPSSLATVQLQRSASSTH